MKMEKKRKRIRTDEKFFFFLGGGDNFFAKKEVSFSSSDTLGANVMITNFGIFQHFDAENCNIS
jgi:hypothetical protein